MLQVLRRAPRILGLLCAVVVAPLPAEALDVGDQVLWGFDNKVVPGCVNPLSVRVFNDTPRPFDGKLELERHWGGDRQTVVVEDCYVSPYTERWVQFYVYVAGGRGGWSLTWGRRADDRMDLEGPKMAAPACVLLADSAATGAGQAQLPLFPADLFPSSVAATKGLHGIVMDAAPAWELPRRRAFLDWLKRGGTLHLIHGTDGRFPRFSEDLSELNGKGNRQRVGSGRVIRHARRRAALTTQYLAKQGFRSPKLESKSSTYLHRFEDTLFAALRAQVKVEHKWWLIHLLVGLYICLIGPANGLLAKRGRRHLPATLFFLAAVLGIGVLLSMVGRRGYGESNTVKSVAIAQSLGDGTYDVSQWSILFTTRSKRYDIRHGAPHNIYSTGDSYKPTQGRIQNGRGGRFRVNMPLFSSVAFLYRGTLRGPTWRFSVDEGEKSIVFPPPLRIEAALGSAFPADPIALWAYHDGRYYALERDGEYLRPKDDGMDSTKLIKGHVSSGFAKHDDWPNDADVRLLMARAVRQKGPLKMGIIEPSVDKGRMRVFVMTTAPETFHIRAPAFDQHSYVLYEHDIILPGQG